MLNVKENKLLGFFITTNFQCRRIITFFYYLYKTDTEQKDIIRKLHMGIYISTHAGVLILKGASVSQFCHLGFFVVLSQILSYYGYQQQK